jgi:hypothetical protein
LTAWLLTRRVGGDWGELDEHDWRENECSVANGFRILSAYTLSTGTRIWIVTGADPSVTTLLPPSEYGWQQARYSRACLSYRN